MMPGGQFPRYPGLPDMKSPPSVYGGVQLGIGTQEGTDMVIFRFQLPITWLGMSSKDARLLAEELVKRADEIDARGRVIVP